jgi:hypothetical protein
MKNFRTLLLVFVLVLGVVETAFGDGVAFSGLDYSSMRPVKQGEQRAVIIHRDGVEKMLIAISLELEDEDKGLWIFPVPGNPETIKLDVLDSFPVFKGVDTKDKAEDLFGDIVKLAFATQIYPTPFVIISDLSLSRSLSLGKSGGFKVSTYYEVEKWGIHTEAIRADSIEDLRGYLKEKGVGIETKELRAFEDYLSDKYVLILAWISSRKELLEEFKEYGKGEILSNKRWPSLYVEFATEKAFYPMRPTRSYGEEHIRIDLAVLDYVRLEKAPPYFLTEYYHQNKAVENVPSKMTQDFSSKGIRYTRVIFDGEAGELNDDLWFIPGAPNNVKNADLIVSIIGNPFGFCIAYICIVSFLSWMTAGLTGLVLFQKWKGYSRLGLWNIFTLIGLCAASYKLKGIVGERFSQTDRFPGRWTFNVLFSIFYLFITGYFTFNLMLVLDFIL